MKYTVVTMVALGVMLNTAPRAVAQQAQTFNSQTFASEHPDTSFFRDKDNRIARVY